MFLEIISKEKKIFSGHINLIKVPGTKGSFEVLFNHAPIISTLDKGEIKVVETNGNEEFFKITGGIIEVNRNQVTVLAETN